MFDVETGKYVKLEGGKASLKAELFELKAQKKRKEKDTSSMGAAFDQMIKEQNTQK